MNNMARRKHQRLSQDRKNAAASFLSYAAKTLRIFQKKTKTLWIGTEGEFLVVFKPETSVRDLC